MHARTNPCTTEPKKQTTEQPRQLKTTTKSYKKLLQTPTNMLFETNNCPGHFVTPNAENIIPATSEFDEMPETFANPDAEDFLSLSDSEFLDEVFDISLLKNTETMLDMTQDEFEQFVKQQESPENLVRECVESMIQQLEIEAIPELDLGPPALPERSSSFTPIGESDELENASKDESFDCSIFDSSDEEVSDIEEAEQVDSDATETDVSGDESEPDVSGDELTEAQERIGELEEEVEETTFGFQEELKDKEAEIQALQERHEAELSALRSQLERKRDRDDDIVEVYQRPKKMRKSGPSYGDERRGCPFCPFEQTTSGYDMRCLKDHLTNGSCDVSVDEMVNHSCTHGNLWCRIGESGWDCLNKMGFSDPENHVNEFLHFKCPNCDFRHYHARKFKRHLCAGLNRGGCGFSKEEAEEIKNQQLRRKNTPFCKV